MKVAAYQAPFLPSASMAAICLIRKQVDRCESEGVEILCCPEAILGGLADYAPDPFEIALNVNNGHLAETLSPLASDIVTTILGFTEIAEDEKLYNSAAIFHRGSVFGIYRKLHPAINRSVYAAGDQIPVFKSGKLTFGIIICNDSNFPELPRTIASKGATALFIPTNNGLPPDRADVASDARTVDIRIATENGISVIRADIAGSCEGMVSHGSSAILDWNGKLLSEARRLNEDLLIADIHT